MLYTFVAAALAFSAPASMVQSNAVVVRSSPVAMSTQYTVAAGLAKKKNPKTGSSTNLMGYKVGDRAPDSAKNSGTTKAGQKLWNMLTGKGVDYKSTAGMNTRDTGPKAKNKERTGSSNALRGYKVGDIDPQGLGAGESQHTSMPQQRRSSISLLLVACSLPPPSPLFPMPSALALTAAYASALAASGLRKSGSRVKRI